METEVRSMLKLIVATRTKNVEVQKKIASLRKTYNGLIDANRERCMKLEKENKRLTDELSSKESALFKEKDANEQKAFEIRAKFLTRIILCNLKNIKVNPIEEPENKLSQFYQSEHALVYDEITMGEKPVNCYEYRIKLLLATQKETDKTGHLITLLRKIWHPLEEMHGGWRSDLVYFERDFKSEKDAIRYAQRNRGKVAEPLIASIRAFEKAIQQANGCLDDVFDFRLHLGLVLDPHYSRSETFKIVKAKKHKLILNAVLSSYERIEQNKKTYEITVLQKGYRLKIKGHKESSEARSILYAIEGFFNTNFEAVEADTNQVIRKI